MTPAFESFLARLYVDANARQRFLADPGREAAAAGLAADEIAAAVRIDRVGLELAAAGFALKRRRQGRQHAIVRLWQSVTRRLGTLCCLLALAGIFACHRTQSVQTPTAPSAGGTPVWQDEFDGGRLPDASRWDYEVGFVRNKELQYYTRSRPENARVEGGMLIIEARRESYEGGSYTSASLTSRANWTYGRVEVRAKLPKGRGTWPAIWTLGTNIREVGWPACGEIDIMEHVGFDPGRIHANIHTTAYNHVQRTNKGNSIVVSAPDEEFHIYSTVWTQTQIEAFVDGQRYFTFAKEPAGDAVWPFDRPQYLILNLAIGGSWGGQQGIDDAAFPTRFVIDYVRVYR